MKNIIQYRYDEIINGIFIMIITFMVILPVGFINWKEGKISETENRVLASQPHFFTENGEWNEKFIDDFEIWIKDNIGLRESMVSINNRIGYYISHKIDDGIYYMLGPNNELNFTPENILEDYHRLNLRSEETINEIAESYQYVYEYLKSRNIQFYRMQCWDKHTIYPEQFPNYIYQYGDISKTDQAVIALTEKTDIQQPDIKKALVEGKKQYDVYPAWGDPSHWNQRGAFIGYIEIMNLINANNGNRYRVLKEEDFNIQLEDIGQTILGGIHEEDLSEVFYLDNSSKPERNKSLLTVCGDDERSDYWINRNVDNNTTLLIIGDSYISSFLTGYFAESFYKVIFIHLNHTSELQELVKEYKPDIIINENAERVNAYGLINDAAKQIRESMK